MSVLTSPLGLIKADENDILDTYLTVDLAATLEILKNAVLLTDAQTLTNKVLTAPTIGGTLSMSTAASKIVPGATSFSVRNNADSADNLLISNAGAVTVRTNLTIGGTLTGVTTLTTSGAINGQTISNAANLTGSLQVGTYLAVGGGIVSFRAMNFVTSITTASSEGTGIQCSPSFNVSANGDVLAGLVVGPTIAALNAHTGVSLYGILIQAVSGAATNISLRNVGASQLDGLVTAGAGLTVSSGTVLLSGTSDIRFGSPAYRFVSFTQAGPSFTFNADAASVLAAGAWSFSGAVTIGGNLGFYGTSAQAKPTVTGSRGGNAALASLLTALAGLGLLTDSSS